MARFMAIISLMLLLLVFPVAVSSAGEFSDAERARLRNETQKLAKTGDAAKQDEGFVALDKACGNQILPRLWLRSAFAADVLAPKANSPEGRARADNYLDAWMAWAKETQLDPEPMAWLLAIRLRYVDSKALREEVALYLPLLEKRGKWQAYENDYFEALRRWHSTLASAGDVDGIRASFARFARLRDSGHDSQVGFQSAYLQIVGHSWGSKSLPLSPVELTALTLAPVSGMNNKKLPPTGMWYSLAVKVAEVAPGEKTMLKAIEEKTAAAAGKNDVWLPLVRSCLARASGDAEAVRRIRVETIRAAVATNMHAEAYRATMIALRGEADDALAAGLEENAMGAARAMFNLARTEADLAAALDLAARVVVKQGGGMEAANAFLGLVNDEKSQPKEWRSARLGEEWRKALLSARAGIDAGADPVAWRQRAHFALIAGDGGAGALSDAAMAYRLPDLSDKSQESTLEAVAMALRAQTGAMGAAERFVKFQTRGASGAEETSGLPAMPAIDAAKRVDEAWGALKARGDKNTSWQDLFASIRNYAAWLSLAGRHDEAFGVLRALYAGAVSPAEIDQAVAGVASLLRARDENLVRANAWRAYQRYGSVGADGKAGTPDDLADPLAGAAVKLPEEWTAYWGKLAADADTRGNWQRVVRNWLFAGDADAARARLVKQREGMEFKDAVWKEHLQYATVVLRAKTGHMAGSQEYADFLRYGAKGKDGKEGTADDLADPLAK